MSAGRCPGCGGENKSCQVIRTHMNTCSEVVQMFKEGKEILDPEDEYRAYRAWLASPEGEDWKEEQKEARRKELQAANDRRLGVEKSRWKKEKP